MTAGLKQVGTQRAGLGEGPVWDSVTQKLWWIDIALCRLYATDTRTGATAVRALPDAPGCLVLTDTGRVALGIGQELLTVECDGLRPVAALPKGYAGRFNDGKVDAAGRLWVGTATAREGPVCDLWRYDPGAGFVAQVPGISMSNGLGWSRDGRLFYYVDTLKHRVDVFDFDVKRGTLKGRRALYDLPEGQLPDGLCVDVNGGIWLAVWGQGCLLHLSPDGALLGRVTLPTPLVTSCAFGGADCATLFVTTARDAATPPEDTSAGRLYALNVGVQGLPPARLRL